MGIGVSNWRLARAVSRLGQLGVVSGTALDSVLARRLQDGDPGGHLRRAMERFPIPGVAAAVLRRYFIPGGKSPGTPYKLVPVYRHAVSRAREELTMLANFVEVHLAREGHSGPVGINLLTKIQLPTLASLYGAMLAGVDCVLMGAGIPREIPAALDAFAEHRPATLRFEVEGVAPETSPLLRLDPVDHWSGPPAPLARPAFLAIIASDSLATVLARKARGRVDGFVIEGPRLQPRLIHSFHDNHDRRPRYRRPGLCTAGRPTAQAARADRPAQASPDDRWPDGRHRTTARPW